MERKDRPIPFPSQREGEFGQLGFKHGENTMWYMWFINLILTTENMENPIPFPSQREGEFVGEGIGIN